MVALPGVAAAVNSGDISLDDYDITNEAKEQIQAVADQIASNSSDDSSSLTQLAQVEAQGFWHWLSMGVGAGLAEACVEGLCEALLLIATPNPGLAIPGVVAGVNDGVLDLDDYDITDEAKEQIHGLAGSIATM